MTKDENYISNFTMEDFMDDGFEEETVLTEDVIYKLEKPGNSDLMVSVDGDGVTSREFGKDPYFKVAKGKSNVPFCRIGFKDGELKYVDHLNQKGRLTKSELKQLEKIMNSKSTLNKFKGYSVWDAIIKSTQDHTDNVHDRNLISQYKKPDFIHDKIKEK